MDLYSVKENVNIAPVNHNVYNNVSYDAKTENVQIADSVVMRPEKAPLPDTTKTVLKDEKKYGTSGEEDKYNSVMTEKAVENANQRVRGMKTTAKFKYDDKIGRVTITIQDADSKEIIKEIPAEEMRKVIEHLHTMRGLLMDEGV